jgi:hypothetical protein
VSADVHSLLGPYVLDAVDDLERAAFDRHLRECADCRAEVAELRDTAARLADSSWSVPPPRLRENVLAEIAATRQTSPEIPQLVRQRKPLPGRRLLAAAAVVVAAAGAGSATWAVQDHRVRSERASAEAAQASEQRIRTLLASPDLVMRDQTLTGGGRVTVAYSRLHSAGVIILAADAAPADGHVFQLWTVQSQRAISQGALGVGQSGTVRVVEGLQNASDVGVTVEPAGGSKAPTLPMVADVKIL